MKAFFFISAFLTWASIAAPVGPPQLLSTSPAFWSLNVDPADKTISVTFDQKMSPGYTAWLGPSSIPPPSIDINPVISQDRRTFTIHVGFEPGKVYVLGLNEKNLQGVGFQNEAGLSTAPAFLVFQTRGNVTPQDTPPHVLRTMPQNSLAIDRSRAQSLTITFDKPMIVKKHGLHMFENNVAVDLSKSQFGYSTDGMTFTLPYAFKPATQYRLELNNVHDIGFSAINRVPLWPVQLSFSTGP